MLRIVVLLCFVSVSLAGPPVSRSRSDIEKFRDFLESSRTERGVRLSESTPQGNIWQNSGKYQGDILLDDEQVESMVEQFSAGRNAYIWPGTLWPSRTIAYEFAPGFDNAQRNYLLYTMSVLESRTCIRFRPRNAGEFNYALITGNADGCYASVGYWASRGVHTINLARAPPGQGCFNPIVIIHEWLHVIGFFHMQSTYNRDNFVRINWANIVRGMEYNFDRFDNRYVSNLGLPYEYDSCMHYDAFAFSTNGRTTMDALRGLNSQMGQMLYVSGNDFWRVDRHYGCSPWRKAEEYEPFYFNENDPIPDFNEEAKVEIKEEANEIPEDPKPELIQVQN